MANIHPPEQMTLPLEPSVIGDLTAEQRHQTMTALALLLLAATDAMPEGMSDDA